MAYRAKSIIRKASRVSHHQSCQTQSARATKQSDAEMSNTLKRQSMHFLKELGDSQGSLSILAHNTHSTTRLKVEWDYINLPL